MTPDHLIQARADLVNERSALEKQLKALEHQRRALTHQISRNDGGFVLLKRLEARASESAANAAVEVEKQVENSE